MSALTVQDAIVDILRKDPAIHAEFNETLTGTMTFTETTGAVVGVNTLFTEELEVGNYIRATTSTTWYRIDDIDGDLSLTLTKVFGETTETGVIGYKSKVRKGLGRNFDYIDDLIGIYVYLMLENLTANTLPHNTRQDAQYPFLVTILFYEPDEELGEERKTAYSQMVRVALENDHKLQNTVYKSDLGDTRHYIHPQIEGSYSLVIPITGSKRETIGT